MKRDSGRVSSCSALSAAGGLRLHPERAGTDRIGRQIADGDAALGRDNTVAAIEAFSGAITLKPDAMVGYLKRGPDLPAPGGVRGGHPGPASGVGARPDGDHARSRSLGDAYLADMPHRYGSRRRAASSSTSGWTPAPAAGPLQAGLRASIHEGPRRGGHRRARAGRSSSTTSSPKPYYLLGLCYRDAQQLDAARKALEEAIRLQPTLHHAREELVGSVRCPRYCVGRPVEPARGCWTALDPGLRVKSALGLAYARAGPDVIAPWTTFGARL